jgi:hypothetical protein
VEGAPSPNDIRYRVKDVAEIGVDVFIPYPHHAPPMRSQIGFSPFVIGKFLIGAVRPAIDLKNQSSAHTGEIGIERTHGMLPANAEPDAVAAKTHPEQYFGVRHLPPQFSRSRANEVRDCA